MQKQCWLLTNSQITKANPSLQRQEPRNCPLSHHALLPMQHLFVFRINYFYQKQWRKEWKKAECALVVLHAQYWKPILRASLSWLGGEHAAPPDSHTSGRVWRQHWRLQFKNLALNSHHNLQVVLRDGGNEQGAEAHHTEMQGKLRAPKKRSPWFTLISSTQGRNYIHLLCKDDYTGPD